MCTLVYSIFLLLCMITIVHNHHISNVQSIRKPHPNEMVHVYFLRTPMAKQIAGNFLSTFGFYHSGLAFVYPHTGFNWTVDFVATEGFVNGIFPKIDTVNTNIIWKNNGTIQYNNFIETSYWNEHTSLVTKTQGFIVRKYMEWLHEMDNNNLYYNLYTVVSQWSDKDVEKRKIMKHGFTCFDFVFESIQHLHKYGANISIKKIKRDHILVHTSGDLIKIQHPEKYMTEIYSQISAIELIGFRLGLMSIIEYIRAFVNIFHNGRYYMRFDNDYYFTYQNLIETRYIYSPVLDVS
jgi:hypothetical protein